MSDFKTGQFTFSELETHLALIVTSINSRPLCILEGHIITPTSYSQHNFTYSSLPQESPSSLLDDSLGLVEKQIEVSKEMNQVTRFVELKQYQSELGKTAAQIDDLFCHIAIQLLPDLLRSYDRSGSEINKAQFNSDF